MVLFLFFIYNRDMTILGVGQSVYDLTYPLKELPIDQKIRVYDGTKCMGGPVTCAMYLCGKWNADTIICSRVGKDAFGQEIIQSLQKVGIDTSYIYVDSNCSTSISSILVDASSGKRTILNMPMDIQTPFDKDLPDSCDVLLFDGHEVDLSLKAFQKYKNAITVFDGDRYKEETSYLIENVDYLICSKQFATEITGHELNDFTYSELTQINKNHVILTLGEKGCLFNGKNYPSYPCSVVDTTGAGDTFHGAFVYGLDQKWSIEKIISYASMASSLCCEHVGGVLGVPSLSEVENALNKM